MAKIIRSKSNASIALAPCHIQWLKEHGLIFENRHQYNIWANENRKHPLLIECIETFYDEMEADWREYNELSANRLNASLQADCYCRKVAQNIIRRKGKGYLNPDHVKAYIRSGKTFEDILDINSVEYRHKSHKHPDEEFRLAAEWLAEYDRLQSNWTIALNERPRTHCEQVVIEEYDDTRYDAEIVLRDNGEGLMREYLICFPKDKLSVRGLECFVGEDTDMEGLLAYLKYCGVEVIEE